MEQLQHGEGAGVPTGGASSLSEGNNSFKVVSTAGRACLRSTQLAPLRAAILALPPPRPKRQLPQNLAHHQRG